MHLRVRPLALALAAVFTLISTPSVLAQAPATPVTVYFDRAHGEGPVPARMPVLSTRLGMTLEEKTGTIDAAALRGHRIVYLRAPANEFTEPERTAIVEYVKSGGSLLLVVDEEQRQKLAVTRVNDVIAPFGLSLTGDTPYLHNTGAVSRAGDVTKGAYELPYSGGRAINGGTAFAWQLDADGKPAQPFAAYVAVPGGGRVVAMAEGMASLLLGTPEGKRLTGPPRDAVNTVYWGKDSEAFMVDVFSWLLRR
ncbi:MAG TPA: hypothetical protein VMF13_19845 [Luteitalea sp.]|nr:hypothetical protein [Luteitalea sp.]